MLEAVNRQTGRKSKYGDQVEHHLIGIQSREVLAQNSNDNGSQIQRYIRLTNLIPDFLDKVDERKLSFIPAVELSYLTKKQQGWLYDILTREEKYGVPVKLASMLKCISQNGELTYEKIDKIIVEKNQEPPRLIRVSYKTEYEKIIQKL